MYLEITIYFFISIFVVWLVWIYDASFKKHYINPLQETKRLLRRTNNNIIKFKDKIF
jgi:hypothetical protein